MQSPRRDRTILIMKLLELDYDFIALQHQVAELVHNYFHSKNHAFHQVLRKTDSGNGRLFFLDAPGEVEKPFCEIIINVHQKKTKNSSCCSFLGYCR
ncbi:hypothetical protein TNCV_1946721 [Trichonephila clavipes]|uniref:Uncharacterized protein n=1 Tax=Trichonephila clavipes TaxID=2585209 RepID=A0A8X6S9X9_TRICX|nr:hypothetical protein TNCV_1946721 [Trichonephila clavipes]